jgi:hypothetical protein
MKRIDKTDPDGSRWVNAEYADWLDMCLRVVREFVYRWGAVMEAKDKK